MAIHRGTTTILLLSKEENSHGRAIWRGFQKTWTGQAPFRGNWGWSCFIQVSRLLWCWCWSIHVVEDKWEQVPPCCESCTTSPLCPRNFCSKWEKFLQCRGHCQCNLLSPCCRQCWQAYLLKKLFHNSRGLNSSYPYWQIDVALYILLQVFLCSFKIGKAISEFMFSPDWQQFVMDKVHFFFWNCLPLFLYYYLVYTSRQG